MCAVACSALKSRRSGKLALPMLFVAALVVDGLFAVNSWVRLSLLEVAALLTVVLVWQTARSQAAKLTYLAVVLISAGSMIAADFLAYRGNPEWARALLFTSVCVKLAAVPLLLAVEAGRRTSRIGARCHHRGRRYGCLRRILYRDAVFSDGTHTARAVDIRCRGNVARRRSADVDSTQP